MMDMKSRLCEIKEEREQKHQEALTAKREELFKSAMKKVEDFQLLWPKELQEEVRSFIKDIPENILMDITFDPAGWRVSDACFIKVKGKECHLAVEKRTAKNGKTFNVFFVSARDMRKRIKKSLREHMNEADVSEDALERILKGLDSEGNVEFHLITVEQAMALCDTVDNAELFNILKDENECLGMCYVTDGNVSIFYEKLGNVKSIDWTFRADG